MLSFLGGGAGLLAFYIQSKPVSYPLTQLAGFNGSEFEKFLQVPQPPAMMVFKPSQFSMSFANLIPTNTDKFKIYGCPNTM